MGRKSEVRSIKTNLGAAAAKFDPGLVSLAALQQQRRGTGLGMGVEMQ
jgi:hypothetical protein